MDQGLVGGGVVGDEGGDEFGTDGDEEGHDEDDGGVAEGEEQSGGDGSFGVGDEFAGGVVDGGDVVGVEGVSDAEEVGGDGQRPMPKIWPLTSCRPGMTTANSGPKATGNRLRILLAAHYSPGDQGDGSGGSSRNDSQRHLARPAALRVRGIIRSERAGRERRWSIASEQIHALLHEVGAAHPPARADQQAAYDGRPASARLAIAATSAS